MHIAAARRVFQFAKVTYRLMFKTITLNFLTELRCINLLSMSFLLYSNYYIDKHEFSKPAKKGKNSFRLTFHDFVSLFVSLIKIRVRVIS